MLGFTSVAVANLFGIPTYRTGGITAAGTEPPGWLSARTDLGDAIRQANAVVLAYGCQEPAGSARAHFRDQLVWLHRMIDDHELTTWMVDGRPRHPSRWHRHTYALHPHLTFAEALPLVLLRTVAIANNPPSAMSRS